MTASGTRARLLGGAAIGLGLAMLGAQPAQAACTVTTTNNPLDTVTCTTTTTTDTSGAGPNDRHWTGSSVGIPLLATVTSGSTVDGFGLAFTVTGGNSLTVTNNGIVQVNAGNTPTAGGNDSALFISLDTGPLIYNGAGSITNLGTGEGLGLLSTGVAPISATVGGSVRADNGDAIQANSTSASGGAITILTAAGQTLRSSGAAGTGGITVNSAGSGNVTINNAANISSGGAGANTLQNGISIFDTGTGNASVTNAGIIGSSTDRAQQFGIFNTIANAASAGTVSVLGSGPIWATNGGIVAQTTGTGGITVNYTGPINTLFNSGINANINNAASAGAINVTGSLGITSGGGGIDVSTNGTGTVTVNYTGAITAAAGDGIQADSTSGNLSVTSAAITAAAGNGIQATSTSGNQTIVANGAISAAGAGNDGIHATSTTGTISVSNTGTITAAAGDGIQTTSTTGNQTVTVGANVTATGGFGVNASSTSGNIAVNVTGGNVTAATTGGRAIIVSNTSGTQTVTIAAGRTVSAAGTTATPGFAILANGPTLLVNNSGTLGTQVDGFAVFTSGVTTSTINNLAGATMNGRVDLGTLVTTNDVVNNAGTWNTASFNRFYAGADAVNNQAGGVINTATGTTFDGLETFTNAGTLNTTGTLGFTGVATNLANTGTINLGAASAVTGLGNYSGSGTINAAAGSSIAGTGTFTNSGRIDTAGAFTLGGFTAMSNAGTIDLAPGTFTVPAVAFTNTGTIIADEGASTITGQTNFANSGTINLSDGVTDDVLTINSGFVGSGASQLLIDAGSNAADRLVITGAASGTTTLSVNGVGAIITTPVLVVDTGTSTAGSFVLGNTAATPLINLTLTRTGQDFFLTSAPNAIAFQPALIGINAPQLWYQSADTYTDYAIQRRGDFGGPGGLGLWGLGYISADKSGDLETETLFGSTVSIDERVKTQRRGLQFGIDYMGAMWVAGVTGGYELANSHLRFGADSVHADGYNLGAYAQYGGPAGIYAGLLGKYDKGDARLTNAAFQGTKVGLRSTGAEGEVGYRWGNGGINVDLGGGLAYVHTKVDRFSSGGITFDFDSNNSLRGRLGGRVTLAGQLAPFIDAKVYHEFEGGSDVTLSSGTVVDTIESNGHGTWGRFEAGIGDFADTGRFHPLLSGWVDVGNVKGFGFRAGARFGGGRAVPPPYVAPAAPPPPPVVEQPAPPPPPAVEQPAPPPPPPTERGQ